MLAPVFFQSTLTAAVSPPLNAANRCLEPLYHLHSLHHFFMRHGPECPDIIDLSAHSCGPLTSHLFRLQRSVAFLLFVHDSGFAVISINEL